MSGKKTIWTEEKVRALGVRTDVPTAGEILVGWCRDESYRAVKRGDFPVPVYKAGRHLVVPVAPILALLGISLPGTGAAGSEPPEPASSPDAPAPSRLMPSRSRRDSA